MDSDKSISVAFTFFDGHGRETEDWLEFPATAENLRQMLERSNFGTAECRMAPMFWENEGSTPIGGLTELPFNEGNVNELNYLAAKLSDLDGEDLAKFEAVIESGRHLGTAGVGIGDMADYINIAENLDNFTFHSDMDESGYGELLLAGPDNRIAALMRELRNNYRGDGEELADLVDCLRESADAEQFGRSMACNNNGEFLNSGYLIEEGGFRELYRDTKDIPDEYRIWEPPDTFIKVMNIDLRGLLMEMHALGGNYTQDAAANLQALVGGNEFFITENRGKLTVLPAADVFRNDSPVHMGFLIAFEPEARAFFASLNDSAGSELWGCLHEIDINEIKSEVARLSYKAVNIDVEFKDGTNRLFTPAEWYELSDWQHEQASGMVYRYDPADENRAAEFINGLAEDALRSGREITQEDFLAVLNAPFMAKAQNAQPDMLRVARETARDMVARSDAEVYRLLPEGALKLSPMDVVKSNGLWFKEHREFAIKIGGLSGLRKWANRTADEIARQAMRDVQHKSRENEL